MACPETQPLACFAGLAERDLVRLAQIGSEEAFQELTSRARDGCIRMATAILRNRDDAEEEVQNAFWKAYTHLSLFSQQSTFSTWVTRIVINHCLMRYRRIQRLRFVPYEAAGSDGIWYIVHEPKERETPESSLGRHELNRVLRAELRRIPALLRVPLELRYIYDWSVEEIAAELRISLTAAKSRLHRAQGYLRDRMLRHCGRRGAATLTQV